MIKFSSLNSPQPFQFFKFYIQIIPQYSSARLFLHPRSRYIRCWSRRKLFDYGISREWTEKEKQTVSISISQDETDICVRL